jgi:hypothetical protein
MAIHLNAADRKALGLPDSFGPQKRKGVKATPASKPNPEIFLAMLRSHGIEESCEQEFEFAKPRKWRFDWVFRDMVRPVALEIQGGIFTGGRHVRGAALLEEMAKLNEACILGYRVLFATPADVTSGAIFPILRRALYGDE